MTELQKALAEQQKAMEETGQPAMSPQEYLYVSVAGKQNNSSQPVSPSRASGVPISPSRTHQSSIVMSRIIDAPESPSKTGNVNAVQDGVILEADAHPATGYPAADDAYMNNLPQELYAPKLFLAKHVTETLQLCLRVLEQNEQKRSGRLTAEDEMLIATIASYGASVLPSTAQQNIGHPVVANEATAESTAKSVGLPSGELVENGLREVAYE